MQATLESLLLQATLEGAAVRAAARFNSVGQQRAGFTLNQAGEAPHNRPALMLLLRCNTLHSSMLQLRGNKRGAVKGQSQVEGPGSYDPDTSIRSEGVQLISPSLQVKATAH